MTRMPDITSLLKESKNPRSIRGRIYLTVSKSTTMSWCFSISICAMTHEYDSKQTFLTRHQHLDVSYWRGRSPSCPLLIAHSILTRKCHWALSNAIFSSLFGVRRCSSPCDCRQQLACHKVRNNVPRCSWNLACILDEEDATTRYHSSTVRRVPVISDNLGKWY